MTYSKDLSNTKYLQSVLTDTSGAVVDQSVTLTWPGLRTGSKVVGWRDKIKAGLDAGSTFADDRYTSVWPKSSQRIDFERISDGARIFHMFTGNAGSFVNLSHVYDVSIPELEAKALSGVYSRLKSERSYFNGLTFVGELSQTIRMLKRPASALRYEVDKLFLTLENRKRKIRKLPYKQRPAEWSKAVSGSVLEANFGWAPLISDIGAIAKAAIKVYQSPPKRSKVSASAVLESRVTGEWSAPIRVAGGYQIWYDKKEVVTSRCRVRYTVGFKLVEEAHTVGLSGIAELSGFTLENVVPTLYELTTMSWLIDYFSNLGDVIEAGTATIPTMIYVSQSIRRETESHQIFRPVSSPELGGLGYVELSLSGGFSPVSIIRRTVSRFPIGALPLPPLVFSHPGSSPRKLANMVSVLELKRKQSKDLSWLYHR